MGILDIFRNGNSVQGTLQGVGTLAKDVRSAITGEISPEKKAEIELKLTELEYRTMEAQSQVVIAEAQGGSWIQRSWRPVTMFTFLFLVVLDSFGLLVTPLAPEAWTLLQIGLGGYVVGRSAEKVVSRVK